MEAKSKNDTDGAEWPSIAGAAMHTNIISMHICIGTARIFPKRFVRNLNDTEDSRRYIVSAS